ncbi:hypothetical protein OAF98_00400 [Planctomicrobium sp.]|jgi:hypothetical protein|nr:hypothetical protein [Planctomicrobium sp.]MBT5018102.1 hypothetical protein [Planctomicrobium sp.]MDB4742917.1 hypothetical protein [Planctomicrobium sp.]
MFFRFIATLAILTGISIYGMNLEKQNLKLKSIVSQQHYELHNLEEQRSRLFLKTQQLGAPPRLIRDWNLKENYLVRTKEQFPKDKSDNSPPPLLEWRLRRDASTE